MESGAGENGAGESVERKAVTDKNSTAWLWRCVGHKATGLVCVRAPGRTLLRRLDRRHAMADRKLSRGDRELSRRVDRQLSGDRKLSRR